MLSPNSLSAFSGATTAAPLQRPGTARLVRDQRDASPPVANIPLGKQSLPGVARSRHIPRGSLLNLSV